MCNEEILKHMKEDMTFRWLSEKTMKSYIWRVSRYMDFHKGKNIEELTEDDIDNGKVTFEWRDYRDKNKMKTMVLDVDEFIRRFILHILPPRFMKIRHFGLLGNRNKTKKLTLCKSLTNTKVLTKENISPLEILKKVFGKDFNLCPVCGIGHLIRPSPV